MKTEIYKFAMIWIHFELDDDNCIVLQPTEGLSDCQNDYINACYIDVSDQLLFYLSCAYSNSGI